ncbi:MAG: MarR family transcriptional regulator, partial [Chloroflexota bacterium]
RAVGRAATSFTPNLDKLQKKGLVERRPDPGDRRAVRIHLTQTAIDMRDNVMELAEEIDDEIAAMFPQAEYEMFLDVLGALQSTSLEN